MNRTPQTGTEKSRFRQRGRHPERSKYMVRAIVGANWEMREKARLPICLPRNLTSSSVFREKQCRPYYYQ